MWKLTALREMRPHPGNARRRATISLSVGNATVALSRSRGSHSATSTRKYFAVSSRANPADVASPSARPGSSGYPKPVSPAVIKHAARRGYLAPLHTVATSGQLGNPELLRSWLRALPQRRRKAQVETLAALVANRDVTLGTTATIEGITDTSTGQALGEPQRWSPHLTSPPTCAAVRHRR